MSSTTASAPSKHLGSELSAQNEQSAKSNASITMSLIQGHTVLLQTGFNLTALKSFFSNLDPSVTLDLKRIKKPDALIKDARGGTTVSSYTARSFETSKKPLPDKLRAHVHKLVLCISGDRQGAHRNVSNDTVVLQNENTDPRDTLYLVSITRQNAIDHAEPSGQRFSAGNDTYINSNEAQLRNVDIGTIASVRQGSEVLPDSLWRHGAFDIKEGKEAPDFQVVVWFERTGHQDLSRPSACGSLSKVHQSKFRRDLNAALTLQILEVARSSVVPEDEASAIRWNLIGGNKVFLNRACEIHRGLEVRQGIEAQLVYKAAGSPQISYKICHGLFLPPVLVSDFLVEMCGPVVTLGKASAGQLAQLAKSLAGIRILVATRSKHEHRVFTIQDLGASVRECPRSTYGILGCPNVDNVKFPEMVCVNVGTRERPFYFPAEFCKIIQGQPFHGNLPLDHESNAFQPTTNRQPVKNNPSQPPGQYADIDAGKMSLAFAEVQIHADGVPCQTVKPAAWASFKSEVGERFGQKLQNAVKSAADARIEFSPSDSTWKTRLGDLVARKSGISTVLVVVVPKQLPREIVDDIKRYCDTVLGVQCHIVSAVEVNKRLRPAVAQDMVKYAGAQVRKIFARAMHPHPEPLSTATSESLDANLLRDVADGDNDTHALDKSSDLDEKGLLVGIQVVSLQDVFGQKMVFCNKTLELDEMFLVTITSTSNIAARNDKDEVVDLRPNIFTSHQVYRVSDSSDPTVTGDSALPASVSFKAGSLVEKVRQALHHHLRLDRKDRESRNLPVQAWERIAIYQYGLNIKDVSILKRQFESFSWKHGPQPEITLTSIMPETTIIPAHPSEALTLEEQGKGLNTFNLENVLRTTFRQPKNFNPKPATHWHIFQGVMKNPSKKDNAPVYKVSVARCFLPDILYLVQQASKRGRLLVRMKSESDPQADVRLPFDVLKVREELQGTLYFL